MGEFECPGFASARRANFVSFPTSVQTAKMKLKRLDMSTILSQPGRERCTNHFGGFAALEFFFIVHSKISIK